jgi:hypothetical protein
MYLHRPTGEYRLLLPRRSSNRLMHADLLPQGQIGCYVFVLGSDQPPRYIGWRKIGSQLRSETPALVRDGLHWFTIMPSNTGRKQLIVFDTIAVRKMCAPVVPAESNIFEMDGTLCIYTSNINATKAVDELRKRGLGVNVPN